MEGTTQLSSSLRMFTNKGSVECSFLIAGFWQAAGSCGIEDPYFQERHLMITIRDNNSQWRDNEQTLVHSWHDGGSQGISLQDDFELPS